MTRSKRSSGVSAGLIVILSVLVAIVAVLGTGYFYFKEKYAGSSVAYSRQAVKDVVPGSLDEKMMKLFYSDEEIAAIQEDATVSPVTEDAKTDPLETDGIRIDPIYGTTYQGYMMLIKDPTRVVVAVNPNMDSGAQAPSLEEYVADNQAVAGINAGGFMDSGGTGNGGQAWGIVIHDGQLISGSMSEFTSVIGIDANNKLICADTSAEIALGWGVRDAVTFGPVFIQDYQVVYTDGTGEVANLNPRTAIGQRADGTFLLLVIDGRGPTSFGALYPDIIKIFQSYDAQTAANLDGGNSTAMIYNGDYLNTPVSMYGSRHLPTAIIVKGEN